MLACEVCVYVSVIMCIYSVISIQFDYNNNFRHHWYYFKCRLHVHIIYLNLICDMGSLILKSYNILGHDNCS